MPQKKTKQKKKRRKKIRKRDLLPNILIKGMGNGDKDATRKVDMTLVAEDAPICYYDKLPLWQAISFSIYSIIMYCFFLVENVK